MHHILFKTFSITVLSNAIIKLMLQVYMLTEQFIHIAGRNNYGYTQLS